MPETVFVSVDRQALHDLESAQRDAERLRQQYRAARAVPGLSYVPLALLYAQAADNCETLRQAYEDAVIESVETERLRERLAEVSV